MSRNTLNLTHASVCQHGVQQARRLALGVALCCTLFLGACNRADSTAVASKPQVTGVRQNPALPEGYVALAQCIADSYQLDKITSDLSPDSSQVLAELKTALIRLRRIKAEDSQLRDIVSDTAQAIELIITVAERLETLPRPPGAGEAFLEGVARGFVGDIPGLLQRAREADSQSDALREQLRHLATALKRVQVAKLQLPSLAERYGGPSVVRGQAVLINFDAPWGPVGPDSTVSLQNNAQDLHHCTILIEIHGATEVVQHVHFVPVWKADGVICAKYVPATSIFDEIPIRQTVAEVQQVHISIWSDELSQEQIDYQHAGAEHDKDVERYCKDLKFDIEYQPFQKGVLWNVNRGARIRLDGIAFLEHPLVTIHFHQGTDKQTFSREIGRWEMGDIKTFAADGQLAWDPDAISLDVGFPGTNYKYILRRGLSR